ncbi:GFA family protein [Ruegeria sp. HKCCA6837]|uniref:GFA family protein n=1 Tax=Ruegeria sp. HKCCA6837 TaxID=2682989 RepID=UPI001488B793|nr:GFA family protein [Ruegeria sp. HKCCA6837]
MERRLAAILAADIVGYSSLMSAHEEGTLARLQSARKSVFDPIIKAHHGRIFKTTGDGLLAEFPSAVDAVRAAVLVQSKFAFLNSELPDAERLLWRMGVNVGDVIFEGADVYGDGVNIAARLEENANPGGFWISRAVFEHVKGKVDQVFDEVGFRKFKNIDSSVQVYRARLEQRESGLATGGLFDFPDGQKKQVTAAGECLCGAIRFELDQPPINSGFCHCKFCQKFTGAPVAVWTAFTFGALRYVRGAPKSIMASPIARREFCGDCGTALTYRLIKPEPSEIFVVFTAAFDNPADFTPSVHAGIESQMPWMNVLDELPRSLCEASRTLQAAWTAAGVDNPSLWKRSSKG